MITVSTSGKSPALSRRIRKELETIFGPEYAECLHLMGKIREQLLASGHDPDTHKKLFRSLLDRGIIQMLKNRDRDASDILLGELLGRGYTFESLTEANAIS